MDTTASSMEPSTAERGTSQPEPEDEPQQLPAVPELRHPTREGSAVRPYTRVFRTTVKEVWWPMPLSLPCTEPGCSGQCASTDWTHRKQAECRHLEGRHLIARPTFNITCARDTVDDIAVEPQQAINITPTEVIPETEEGDGASEVSALEERVVSIDTAEEEHESAEVTGNNRTTKDIEGPIEWVLEQFIAPLNGLARNKNWDEFELILEDITTAESKTILIPKGSDPALIKNWRPIAL
ncbi:hypothetical protein HAZT_HAZT003461 [Hyalella azteca]|uniref:Uncharacterized protein n=1 Tax=Hyalella azteca TaxID=294128 RepID=A0A6A0HDM0_HYAAZ|nr:hypothetical protein HAZT_HAZT003461 [Hyalella azteca]